MKTITLTVNGKRVAAEVDPRTHLADFLREHCRLTGTHLGCEHGVCGACTVEIDGEIARSCTTLAVACDGASVRTVEGFDDDPLMADLRDAFRREHGLQCGFCTPGMLITARDVVRRLGAIDEARLRTEMSGNLCRCTGYLGIVNAILSVMADKPAGAAVPAPAPVFVLAAAPAACSGATAAQPCAAHAAATAVAEAPAGMRLTESFTVRHAPATVWAFLDDLSLAAPCLPGAELIDYDGGDSVKGRVTVKFGPIQAAFSGDATRFRDPERRSGGLRGSGRDRFSGSRATGEVSYAVEPCDEGSRVSVAISFSLTGPLAQFSRSSLVKDFVGRLTRGFADNLQRRLDGVTASDGPAATLAADSLIFAVVWDRLKSLWHRLLGRT